jgi:ribonuclease BN (tRNA processing enzyme)
MQLTVVGAGPAYSDRAGSTGAAYLVRAGRTAVLLDLGQGSFPRLAGLLDPADLAAVVISHLHPDHFIDLVPLRHYLRWEVPRRRVRVIGPAGLADRLDALHDEPGFAAQALDIEPLEVGSQMVGDFEIEARRVTHTGSSYGFRLTVPGARGVAHGLVYSGAEDLDALIRPGDTLLSEVSFGPGPAVPGAEHLDGPAVGALACRTGAGRVLLTHLQMGNDRDATLASVRAAYDGPVELVDPGFEATIE